MMDSLGIVNHVLKVPYEYIKSHTRPERVQAIVHLSWLRYLLKTGELMEFVKHEKLSCDEVRAWLKQGESFGPYWQNLIITVIEKPKRTVIPLPRARSGAKPDTDLTFHQIIHYVAQTNYKNLWKEAYKKYSHCSVRGEHQDQSKIHLTDCTAVLKTVINRAYGCPVINFNGSRNRFKSHSTSSSDSAANSGSIKFEPHPNILPAILAVETDSHFLILQEYQVVHSLLDCVRFSPALLTGGHTKPLFLIYQLLRLMRHLHDYGLALGDITLSDVLISDNLWIQVMPRLEANIYNVPEAKNQHQSTPDDLSSTESQSTSQDSTLSHCTTSDINAKERQQELGRLCEAWVKGLLSNFDYLTALNGLAGRRYGDPRSHHVFPWVTDFTSRNGANWRDLTRSKFRLNKGDRQLDLTYDLPPSSNSAQVPHHVSDVLSEITYYVYLCRVTPRSVLQKYVRPQWVPAEYPSSIQRLQEWTPDECIPEFFTDPTVFKSIHPDLPDLEVPNWALSPDDLVSQHRAILESTHVSDRLHHWIDLTFGYKLSGAAAVKSKNVCLQLVDGHTQLTDIGVVQLFAQPHPPRTSPSPYLGKTPPLLLHLAQQRDKKRIGGSEEEDGHSSGQEDDESQVSSRSTSISFSKFLSRSRTSLHLPTGSSQLSPNTESAGAGSLEKTASASSNTQQNIVLPRDYNPVAALVAVESLHGFLNKTCHIPSSELAATNNVTQIDSVAYKQVVAARRVQEMQVLGCLITELFIPSKLHVFGCAVMPTSLIRRVEICRSVLQASSRDNIPHCLRALVNLLLQSEGLTVTNFGTPPPSAHQLLQPNLTSSLLPFPKMYPQIYNMFKKLQEYCSALTDLKNLCLSDTLDGINRSNGLSLLAEKINEWKVKSIVQDTENLVEKCTALVGTPSWINLLLPHILPLLSDRDTCVSAAWYLFDPIARALGPIQSCEVLLEPMVQLYDWEIATEEDYENTHKLRKRIKIYHRSFLLHLIVRFGLRVFLENFTRPLVEAVGGYYDFDNQSSVVKSTTHHIICGDTEEAVECDEVSYPGNTLSPLDEDSSVESERVVIESTKTKPEKDEKDCTDDVEPEVFVLDTEESPAEKESGSKKLKNLLLDQLALDDQSDDALDEHTSATTVRSPIINIPCDGEEHWKRRKSEDSFSSSIQYDDKFGKPAFENAKLYMREVSEVSGESVVWLAHRLGPVLTARYLSRNLLRMLALCYMGADNLSPVPTVILSGRSSAASLSAPFSHIVADESSVQVLECLSSIAALYGEQFIILQYLPHIAELIALCKRKLTPNLEGGLIGCLVLFKHILPYISDSTLDDILQDVILKTIIHPSLRLLVSIRLVYPSGVQARFVMAVKLLDCLYILAVRVSIEHRLLLVHTVQRFFLAFSKARGQPTSSSSSNRGMEKDNTSRIREYDSTDSCSPPQSSSPATEPENNKTKAFDELKVVLSPELAHVSFTLFANFFGETFMEQTLKNYDLIRELCEQYKKEQELLGQPVPDPMEIPYISEPSLSDDHVEGGVGSFGTNVMVVGNRIDLQEPLSKSGSPGVLGVVEDAGLAIKKMENSSRHLRGNWLAYWEHEIGRSGKDNRFNVKQIKLQSFGGHTNRIRALHVLDNENSFFSASQDKTVKLWSLRSQGDGSAVSHCQWTYTGHKKGVLALGFVERLRLAVSSDSSIHFWDPFVGRLVSQSDSKLPPINMLKPLPAPSSGILAATADTTLRTIDARTVASVNELKVSINPASSFSCILVSPGKNWVALGQFSGYLTILDLRTGTIIASWRGHEGEILQLVAMDDHMFISSSVDLAVSAWSASDGKLLFNLKGPTEPFNCLALYGNELISGTTANRIGVHTAVDVNASFSSTRLRSDTLKGVLNVMELLPLNRMLLLGADTGAISLLC
ncbi:WD repeat domain 81 [Lycorma delicatula]|uniref:WD repeat domain 81 n=1 Tax=Lycorma delicatula TaxID=130591 RepID=UPI003F513142